MDPRIAIGLHVLAFAVPGCYLVWQVWHGERLSDMAYTIVAVLFGAVFAYRYLRNTASTTVPK